MKKVYLFCSNGMSTSMLASRMQDVANQHNIPIKIEAFPMEKMDEIFQNDHPDCVLLGPQVQHQLETVKEKYQKFKTPIDVIDQDDYGNMNGERILKKAILMIQNNK